MTAPVAVERTKQVFRFLKAFSERKVPIARRLSDHFWTQRLVELPDHPSVQIGEVQIAASNDASSIDSSTDAPLIVVKRPRTTPAPEPPDAILDFLGPGWRDPEKAIDVVDTRNVIREGETVVERFEDDPVRVDVLAKWRTTWIAWAEGERPARQAMRAFERLYDLKGRIDRESEGVELILGDGRLRWMNGSAAVDHPVLLQRVELVFDPDVPEFRILDSDREPELYSAILQDDDDAISPQSLNTLRVELEKGGYHPLAKDGTSGYLRRVVQTIAADGVFEEEATDRPIGAKPFLSRDPVLLLRKRASGFSAAFDRVLADLEQRAEVPLALSRLVGVEEQLPTESEPETWSPWGEPPDILLSKPANQEQIHIARALDSHKAVLVQGPPGTGKSHTIANLVGHLVAQGKRVLITSHTTKALRVLRGQIVETLRPLCVALLENDLEGRAQMEEAVKGILARLTNSSASTLEREVASLAEERSALNEEIASVTRNLLLTREGEYHPIIVNGEAIAPSEAARWVKEAQLGNDWIPGPVGPGAPVPLSDAELRELYDTNARVSRKEEVEIAAGLPLLNTVPTPEAFKALIEALDAEEPPALAAFWDAPPAEVQLPQLHRLESVVNEASGYIRRVEPWQKALIAAGHSGGADVELWKQLASMTDDCDQKLQSSKAQFVEHDPHLPSSGALKDAVRISRELEQHLHDGGSLGTLSLLLHGEWKAFVRDARCNGSSPSSIAEIRALRCCAELGVLRMKLAQRWGRLAEPVSLPPFSSFGDAPEAKLKEYTSQFETLLEWWPVTWSRIATAMKDAGFRWDAFRRQEIARSGPKDPFESDVAILNGALLDAVSCRVAVANRLAAMRLLSELDAALASYQGTTCRSLHRAIRSRDVGDYGSARAALDLLYSKVPVVRRRQELLAKLQPTAPAWASAIHDRLHSHEGPLPSVEIARAWRWRQLHQELERRAALDEVKLTRKLHELRDELRRVTTTLIDRRAWLGQIRRTGLSARQALQGWAQTQRRIGKGTGKRVPALQAEARKLLGQARSAVPVWIMPLSRVAESFDGAQEKFDVVIVDEASQSDVSGLLAWYLGDRVAIVGDHEQVSPLGVGQQLDSMSQLISQYLMDVPNRHLYDGKLSIYDLARQSFAGTIALREHFRCVPDIIDFSNYLSYNGDIRPLRDPTRVPRPHVIEYVVDADSSASGGKRNPAEARMIVAIMKALAERPEHEATTMGAISLVGEEQAGLIQDLALEVMGAVELDRHRFAAGNPAQFQGDERDIVFLSMVDVPTGQPLRLRQDDLFKQRYNVAASRARNQLWLIHSLKPDRDLNAADLRRRLIEHVRNPAAKRGALEVAQARAESPFEKSVLARLISAGYRAEPQV